MFAANSMLADAGGVIVVDESNRVLVNALDWSAFILASPLYSLIGPRGFQSITWGIAGIVANAYSLPVVLRIAILPEYFLLTHAWNMPAHPLVSELHAQRIQSLWAELKLAEDGSHIVTEKWKKLLAEATPEDLGHYAFSLLLSVGFSVAGGIDLEPFKLKGKGADPIHNLILVAKCDVLRTKQAEFSSEQLVAFLGQIDMLPSHLCHSQISYGWLVVGGLKPHFKAKRKVTPELVQAIRQLHKNMSHVDGGYERYLTLMEKLLGDDQIDQPILWRSDAWMTAYCDLADGFDDQEKSAWDGVLKVAFAAKGSKPSKKFLQAIDAAVAELGESKFVPVMHKILNSLGEEGPMVQRGFMGFMDYDKTRLDRGFTDLLRALVWATADFTKLTEALGNAAAACFEPVANTGGRCNKVGVACIRSLKLLGNRPAMERIKQIYESAEKKSIRKAIDRALKS